MAIAHPHVNINVEMRRSKRHAKDAPFVKSRGVWTLDRHVWIYRYVSRRRRTYILHKSNALVTRIRRTDVVEWSIVRRSILAHVDLHRHHWPDCRSAALQTSLIYDERQKTDECFGSVSTVWLC